MNDDRLIRITAEDIAEANRLSLSCPICAGAVEKEVSDPNLSPVVCGKCHTLYHQTCWRQNNGKCAILGCGHNESFPYGVELGPRIKVKYSDLPKHVPAAPVPNGRNKRLKEEQRRQQMQAARRDFWDQLVNRILRAIGWR